MKTRESGMPEEELWASFFTPRETLVKLGLTSGCRDVVDFGCGYGTFAVPAAELAQGVVHALDIEPEMVAATLAKARAAGLTNVRACRRDFIEQGTGLDGSSVDYAMLFNILHAEQPIELLREAFRVLRPGGRAGIMHWRPDPATPRGPSLAIRPRPEQCREWARAAGFRTVTELVELPPYHYGIIIGKVERT